MGDDTPEVELPEPLPALPRASIAQQAMRVGLALIVGVVVVVLALWSAWLQSAKVPGMSPERFRTHGLMMDLGRAMAEYRESHGVEATSFEGLKTTRAASYLRIADDGSVHDAWDRACVLERDGDGHVVILSYGHDGRPGGIGLDQDMRTGTEWRDYEPPTLHQFIYVCQSEAMIRASQTCGLLAAILVWFLVKPATLSRAQWRSAARQIVGTLIGATVGASFLVLLHIPNGH